MTKKPESPFAKLAELRDRVPVGSPEQPQPPPPRGPARAVVRLERKQRGGKEVTVIDRLGLSTSELARWCRELKHALGCGGAVEGDAIVLQGDVRQRVPELLTARGVARVTIGS